MLQGSPAKETHGLSTLVLAIIGSGYHSMGLLAHIVIAMAHSHFCNFASATWLAVVAIFVVFLCMLAHTIVQTVRYWSQSSARNMDFAQSGLGLTTAPRRTVGALTRHHHSAY